MNDWLSYLIYSPDKPLLFNSGLFLILFLLFFGIFLNVQKSRPLRIIWTIVFSLFFYYKSSGFYFWILIASTLIDYGIGWAIYHSVEQWKKRLFLILSLCSNLGILGYFKYTNFFIDTINAFGGNLSAIDLFLPVGISFYTFQTLSYSIDIYRGKLEPTKNVLDFAFFVSFFPQLVAGPIVRAADFLPQIREKLFITRPELGKAILLIGAGLFKKAVISDYISINFVDRVFEAPALYSGFENLMGVYGYAIQIYCDFSGYSDMAIGLALLLGFRLPVNFNSPYKAASLTEFWRRWHISLSTWLRDYLYISLGGNRKGNIRTYVNLLLTMLLGGLWHGANWKFVLWGAMHGGVLAIERFIKEYIKIPQNVFTRILGMIITFHIVCFCWIFFRAKSYDLAVQMIQQIVYYFSAEIAPEFVKGYPYIILAMGVGYLLHLLPDKTEQAFESFFIELPLLVKSFFLACIVWVVAQTASSEVVPFIYFQF